MNDTDWSSVLNEIKQQAVASQSAAVPEVDKSLITIDETSGVPLWM